MINKVILYLVYIENNEINRKILNSIPNKGLNYTPDEDALTSYRYHNDTLPDPGIDTGRNLS